MNLLRAYGTIAGTATGLSRPAGSRSGPAAFATLLVAASVLSLSIGCLKAAKRDSGSSNPPVEQSAAPADKTEAHAKAGCAIGDCRNGTGTYRYENGDVYAGGFRGGLREGAGSYRFANGDVLNTTFRGGRAAGSGSYVFKDGRVFRGEFSNSTSDLTGQGLLRAGSSSQFCVLQKQSLRCEDEADSAGDANTSNADAPRTSHLLVLFASENCRIIRGGRTLTGGPGLPLFAGDRIESGSEAVELQGRGGIAIRLRPFSVLEIPPGTNDRGGILYLRKGGVAVDYQGDPKKIPFRINAQNANFDVQGTTFMVEIDDVKGTAKVRVFEGTVSISPSLPAIERLKVSEDDARTIDTGDLDDQEYQQVAEALMKQTMRVSANQEGELSESTLKSAEKLNAAIETTIAERQSSSAKDEADAANGNMNEDAGSNKSSPLSEAAANFEQSKPAAPQAFVATPQESAEMQLLITVDSETFEQAVAETGGDGQTSAEVRASVEKAYDERLDTRATALQKNLAADQNIRTQADLIKRYKFLEVITFRDGKQKAGSIAAQAGSILIMHAPDGVFRMSRDDIKQIDYYDVVQDGSPAASPEATSEAPGGGDSLK